MPFIGATRRKFVPLPAQSKGATSPLKWDITKAGVLGGIYLAIRGTVTGTVTVPNAFGMASIVRGVRVFHNASGDIDNFTGPQYDYIIRDHIEDYKDPVPANTGRNAVTATTFILDKYIPLAVSAIDQRGLINLQDEGVTVSLTVEFETDSVVATGATVAATVTPYLELFTLPRDPKDQPAFSVIHQIMAETRAISGAGEVDYAWPLGNAYIALYHCAGYAQVPAESWSKVIVRAQQTDRMYEYDPQSADLEYSRWHGRARLLGVIPVDFAGSEGLGMYGGDRDFVYSQLVSDLRTTITCTGATTFTAIRRMLVAA